MLRILFILIFFFSISSKATFCQDSIPLIPIGPIDWTQLENASWNFNKKDAVRAIISWENLGAVFNNEPSGNYLKDFHFVDINHDEGIDVVFSGMNVFHKGYYTYVFISGTKRYEKKFEGKGFVGKFTSSGAKISMTLRNEPLEGKGLTRVVSIVCTLDSMRTDTISQGVFVPGTEIPGVFFPTAGELKFDCTLRTSPDAWDLSGGETGNLVAGFKMGTKVVNLASKTANGNTWNFVMIYQGIPMGSEYFQNLDLKKLFIAGWIEETCLSN